MDVFTHSLTALAIGMAGYDRWGRKGLLGTVAAANLPELERVVSFGGAALWMKSAYGAGHSLITAPAIGVLLAILLRRWLGGWNLPATVAGLGLSSHILLDLVSGPGVRLLWPFSLQFYGLTVMASYDVLMLLTLGVVLTGPALLNLVNRDIGAATYRRERPARFGLILIALLLLVRVGVYVAYEGQVAPPSTAGFILAPSAIQPLTWYVISDLGPAYTVEEFTFGNYGRPIRFRKPPPNRAFETAADTPLGQAFLEMAQFPQYSLERGDRGMLVRIRDMRFYSPAGDGKEYSVEIEVTPQLQVVAQRARM